MALSGPSCALGLRSETGNKRTLSAGHFPLVTKLGYPNALLPKDVAASYRCEVGRRKGPLASCGVGCQLGRCGVVAMPSLGLGPCRSGPKPAVAVTRPGKCQQLH